MNQSMKEDLGKFGMLKYIVVRNEIILIRCIIFKLFNASMEIVLVLQIVCE